MRSRCPSVTSRVYGRMRCSGELRLDQREGQLGADQRDVRLLPQEVGDGADVVLVAVCEDDALDVVEAVPDGREVRQDQVDSGLLLLGEEDAAVDDEQAAAVLEDGHVAADLAEAAQRGDPEARPSGASAERRVQDADDSKDSPHHTRHVPVRHVARMTFVQKQLLDVDCGHSCSAYSVVKSDVRAVPRRQQDRS